MTLFSQAPKAGWRRLRTAAPYLYLTGLARRLRVNAAALLAALCSLLALLGLTAWIWANESREIAAAANSRFEFRVSEAQAAIRQRMLAYEQVLRGGVALFATKREVTRRDWHNYVETLAIEHNYPGIQGIGYAAFFPPGQLKAHLATVRADGFADYVLRPPGVRQEYSAILYIEPFDWRNQRAFGYDMLTEPVRRAALQQAVETGRTTVTGKVKLVQETSQGVQAGFLMFLPVFRDGRTPPDAAARKAALLGYVYAPFRMNNLMLGILGSEKLPKVRLKIFDGESVAAEHEMFDSLESPAPTGRAQAVFHARSKIEVGGRQWTLQFESLPAFEADIDWMMSNMLLFAGSAISVLFAAIVLSMSLNRRRARALAVVNGRLEHEIAARARLQGDLELARDKAEAANRAKSEFLAAVSHELRTPLTLILAPLEQLLGTAPQENWRAQLERAERNALLLQKRVNDILDFSKVEAGKLELEWEALDAAALVTVLADDAAALAHERGCTLTWQADPALGTVCLDRACFEKIVLNLLSNALKFTPRGGAIRLELKALPDDRFELSVQDSGIGIAADKLPGLFQRFSQVDSSIQRQYGGTGIGLALVRELAERMGGSVAVESEAGRGSCFTVVLPCGSARLGALPAAAAPAAVRAARLRQDLLDNLPAGAEVSPTVAQAPPAPSGASLPHVLVADDNQDMRDYLVELLRPACTVHAAADGMQAWELLQKQAIDVVVSDVMMPELDGLSLCARIKASPLLAHVQVLLVTARGGHEASVAGLEGGADDYIAKPFSAPELVARVHSAVRVCQLHKRLRLQAHDAGMAMIASGILHNLGNVLSGVTVSAGVLNERMRKSRVPMLQKTAQLLEQHQGGLPAPVASVPEYLQQLARHFEEELGAQLQEIAVLRGCIDHARAVIASEQKLGQLGGGMQELLMIHELLDLALQLAQVAFDFHDIAIERDYAYKGAVQADMHKLIQILLNLLSNAAQAVHALAGCVGVVRVATRCSANVLQIEICDNGIGLEQRQIEGLFNQRFTTADGPGHGYGLHSSANWAREMGGALTCTSAGAGQGACFRLELPLEGRDAG